MRAMVEVSDEELAERARKGHDRFDEMWNGVLHMNPPPGSEHQGFGSRLFVVCAPLAMRRGLRAFYETGLYRSGVDNDWRVPDHIYCSPELVTKRGVEGPAELVVEILTPSDESYEKLGFYSDLGEGEVLIIDPVTARLELFEYSGGLVPVQSDDGVHVAALDAQLATIDGRLRIEAEGVSTDI
jgi:Uma2 family endonuclease